MLIKKYDDERNDMKNNIEQNNKMQELFIEKDNIIKKKDSELQMVQTRVNRLENENEEQKAQIDVLKGGCVFLQKFKEDDYARLRELIKKSAE